MFFNRNYLFAEEILSCVRNVFSRIFRKKTVAKYSPDDYILYLTAASAGSGPLQTHNRIKA